MVRKELVLYLYEHFLTENGKVPFCWQVWTDRRRVLLLEIYSQQLLLV